MPTSLQHPPHPVRQSQLQRPLRSGWPYASNRLEHDSFFAGLWEWYISSKDLSTGSDQDSVQVPLGYTSIATMPKAKTSLEIVGGGNPSRSLESSVSKSSGAIQRIDPQPRRVEVEVPHVTASDASPKSQRHARPKSLTSMFA
jgi:hypothetical protein